MYYRCCAMFIFSSLISYCCPRHTLKLLPHSLFGADQDCGLASPVPITLFFLSHAVAMHAFMNLFSLFFLVVPEHTAPISSKKSQKKRAEISIHMIIRHISSAYTDASDPIS